MECYSINYYNSWNVHENNIHTLLIEIYKPINNSSPPIMKDLFDLKKIHYDLRNKQLLKLPETNTSRYIPYTSSTVHNLIWNMIPNKFKNLVSIDDFKKHIKNWKTCYLQL